jgi:tetratricopeptide (TPR) repeat protein
MTDSRWSNKKDAKGAEAPLRFHIVLSIMLLLMVTMNCGIAKAKEKPLRTIKVKIVADQHFSRMDPWKRKAERQLLDIAAEVRENIHVNLEIIEFAEWEHEEEADLYRLISKMISEVDRGEADILIGFTFGSCPDKLEKNHADGVTIPYRGMMIRNYSSRCPRSIFMPYVMIHEMVHLMGGVHVHDGSLMSPVFADTVDLWLDPINKKILGLTSNIDFQKKYTSLEEGTLEQLAAAYRQAAEAGNHETVTLSELGTMYLVLEEFQDSEEVLDYALSRDSSFTRVWLLLVECCLRSDATDRAVLTLETALDYADDKGQVYSRLARLYFDLDDKEAARHNAVQAEKHGTAVDSVLWNKIRTLPEKN